MNTEAISPPTNDTHFLVSGGGKGITAENVVSLAEAFQSRFTLLGRSKLLSEEPEWALDKKNDSDLKQSLLNHFQSKNERISPKEMDREVRKILSSREIRETMRRVQDAGGEVDYIQADITDPKDLETKLSGVSEEITGLLHGAGSLADKFIEEKTEADFDLVYGVKVDGLKNILDIISPANLQYIIFFSSVAGFYGNAGQADYSLANDVLNKFAHYLNDKYPHSQVIAIDWGPWDGGMVSPQLKRILTKKKVHVISIEEGTSTLVNLLSGAIDSPQWVVGSPMPAPSIKIHEGLRSYRILRRLTLKDNPFLADHVIGGKAVLPTVCAVDWFIKSCEKLYPGFQYFEVRDYQVFKGIVFDDDLPDHFLLELKEEDKSQKALIFQGKISSQSPEGKTRYHYQAQVELRKSLPESPRLADYKIDSSSSRDGLDLYQDKVLFHGPSFQGVKEILESTPNGLTIKCNLRDFSFSKTGQFPIGGFNPYLADVHLQSLLIWAWDQYKSTGLPLKIARGTQYRIPPVNEDTFARMEVASQSKHKILANVTSFDQHGNVFTEVEGAEITLNESLLKLFQENSIVVEKL
jgi:NAD(P)-dependent dehydrogenase (short-subunit alcohol dehydrogenase family)